MKRCVPAALVIVVLVESTVAEVTFVLTAPSSNLTSEYCADVAGADPQVIVAVTAVHGSPFAPIGWIVRV